MLLHISKTYQGIPAVALGLPPKAETPCDHAPGTVGVEPPAFNIMLFAAELELGPYPGII